MRYIFCAYREYSQNVYKKLKKKYRDIFLVKKKEDLTISNIRKIGPKYIFFPDWSWIVPNEIVKLNNCICLHESNLPKFRGGSPIQNQIIKGIKKTKTTAFLMNSKLDAGDILLQQDLSLKGSLDDILSRMEKNDYEIICKIIQGKFKRHKQRGAPSFYKRRTPEQSELINLNYPKSYMYNFIRMLADPYPNAFIRIGKRRIIFKSSKFDGRNLSVQGVIE